MNRLFLRLVKIFNPLWSSMGVNPAHLNAILRAKLKIDSRRKSGMYTGVKSYSESYTKYLAIFLLFLVGAAILALSLEFDHVPTGLTIYFSIWMVLLSMTIVMDFSDVLVDIRDSYTLLPTPINDATLSISRILRILIYLSKQALAFIFPALIYWFFNDKWGMLVFVLLASLTLVMSVSLVTLFYFTAIKFTSASRLKNVINNLQIVFTISIFAAYYILPELIDMEDMANTNIYGSVYSYLAPPAWIAAIWEFLINKVYTNQILIHVSLSILGTLGALVFIAKYLSKDFGQQLFSVNMATTSAASSKTEKTTEGGGNYLDKIASLLTFDKVEKAAFKFCYRYLSRNRMFKLKTYPVLGYIPIMIVSVFFRGEVSFMDRYEIIQAGDSYIFVIYVVAFLGYVSLTHALYSDTPSQAWIFRSAPIAHPKSILYALYKVIFVKFLLPFWLLLLCISICIWGSQVIDDFLFGGVVLLFLNAFCMKITFKSLPFTRSWSDAQQGGSFVMMFVLWGFIGIIIAIHYILLKKLLLPMALATLVLLITFYFIWRSFEDLTWDKLDWD